LPWKRWDGEMGRWGDGGRYAPNSVGFQEAESSSPRLTVRVLLWSKILMLEQVRSQL